MKKLIKIGAKVVSHARYVAFQMAGVSIPRKVFADILRMIAELGRHKSHRLRSAFRCRVSNRKRGERCISMAKSTMPFSPRNLIVPPGSLSERRTGPAIL